MTKKRFNKRIENARKRGDLEEGYVPKFEQLFMDAKKDEQGKVSSENLIEAIAIMLQKEDMSDDSTQKEAQYIEE